MRYVFILMLLSTSAFADEPTWEVKRDALLRAYKENNYSMTGWGSYDATQPRVIHTEKVLPQAPEPVLPKGDKKSELVEPPKRTEDTCTRHKMHKVYNRRHTSWNCRR